MSRVQQADDRILDDRILVADLVAILLERLGVDTVFGITSVHNLGLLDAIGRRESIRFVMARGEMGGAHMADGYARATGKLGVLFTSTGPAAASAAPGVLEAYLASTPMLHITGQSAVAVIGRGTGAVHDVPDQLAMLRSVSKAAYRVETPEALLETFRQAATDALTEPRGPVSIEIPIDIQKASTAKPAGLDDFSIAIPAAPAASPDAIADVAERIAAARRPLLWLGGGATASLPAVKRLLDMGFCAITSWNGRGIVPETDPRTLGALNGVLSPIVDNFCRKADLLVVAGSRLRHQQTREMRLFLPKPLIQIDIDPAAQDRTYKSDAFLCGDATATLDALANALEGRLSVEPGHQTQFAAMKTEAIAELCGRHGVYSTFPRQLREAMPRDALWVRDMTMSNNTWGQHAFPIDRPRDSIFPAGGGIGVGLPLAIGAAVGAYGRKTVLLSGDGGFFLNPGELWTAVQEQLDLTMIVMNDRGYGVIKHLQNAAYGGRQFFTDLLTPDLEEFARLAGIAFRRVTDAEDFGAAVGEMIAVEGPALVEVDMTAVGTLPYTPLPQTAVAAR